MDLQRKICTVIEEMVSDSSNSEIYRQPLIGFANAQDPLFQEIKAHISEEYLMPTDLLPGAQTVVSYFLPFQRAVVLGNVSGDTPSKGWQTAYFETNRLLAEISARLIEVLAEEGVQAVTVQPTNNFDRATLLARWSHKHTAYVTGLGSFGHHHLLITEAGCAGRFGSIVIDATLPATARSKKEFCLRKNGVDCSYCFDHCPSGALSAERLDREVCNAYLLKISETGIANSCGKCSLGPCAIFE